MIKPVETDEHLVASDCPPGTFAGTVMTWSNPSKIFLYSERGNKFESSQAFYKSLWDRGFRYFKYAYRGKMFKLVDS